MFLSPDVQAFRLRSSAPRGGEGHFVQGNYTGRLAGSEEKIELVDGAGRLIIDAE